MSETVCRKCGKAHTGLHTATCKNCGKKIVFSSSGQWQHAYGQQSDDAKPAS